MITKVLVAFTISQALICGFTPDRPIPSGDEILAGVESVNVRRHHDLKEYSGSRQYTLESPRFSKPAAVAVLMTYKEVEGERYTVVTRSGSNQLNGIIDKVLASEAASSVAPERARHQISAANYRVRLLGTETVAGRRCFVLELTPKAKSSVLIIGKAWVDTGTYAVVQIDGQFAASKSILLGAPRIHEEFIDVHGFWLPSHVRSVTSSFLLGPSELDIQYTNYQLGGDVAPAEPKPLF